jgi:hypothetical protein
VIYERAFGGVDSLVPPGCSRMAVRLRYAPACVELPFRATRAHRLEPPNDVTAALEGTPRGGPRPKRPPAFGVDTGARLEDCLPCMARFGVCVYPYAVTRQDQVMIAADHAAIAIPSTCVKPRRWMPQDRRTERSDNDGCDAHGHSHAHDRHSRSIRCRNAS